MCYRPVIGVRCSFSGSICDSPRHTRPWEAGARDGRENVHTDGRPPPNNRPVLSTNVITVMTIETLQTGTTNTRLPTVRLRWNALRAKRIYRVRRLRRLTNGDRKICIKKKNISLPLVVITVLPRTYRTLCTCYRVSGVRIANRSGHQRSKPAWNRQRINTLNYLRM